MKKALIGLMVLTIIGWGSVQLFAAYSGDKGKTPDNKGKNEQVNPGDNRDDQNSGKVDQIDDGNSGQGDDKKTDQQARNKKIDILKKYDKDGDGKLNDAEKAQMKADRDARRLENPNKPGKKGDDKGRDGGFDNDRQWDEGSVQKIMDKYDKDRDGKLNAQELSAYRADEAKHGRNQEEQKRDQKAKLLKKYDKDGDGKLSDAEKAQWKADCEAERNAHQSDILKKYDKDGDGKLSDAEKAQMKADQDTRRAEAMRQLIKKLDKDGDSELNLQELARYIKATHNPRRTENINKSFKRWDKDGDGKFSPEERESAREWYRDHPDDKDGKQWKEWEKKNQGVRDHGKGEGRDGRGQGKGQGQGPKNGR